MIFNENRKYKQVGKYLLVRIKVNTNKKNNFKGWIMEVVSRKTTKQMKQEPT